MTDHEPTAPPPPPPSTAEVAARSYPLGTTLAWLVILALAAFWMISAAAGRSAAPGGEAPTTVPAASQLAGRIVLAGRDALVRFGSPPGLLLENAAPLREGQPVEQIAYAILVAAVETPERGLAELDRLLPQDDPTPELSAADQELAESVRERLERWVEGASPAERALEQPDADRLGFFAEVLAGSVTTSAGLLYALIGVGAWYLAVALTGLVLLMLIAVFTLTGALRSRLGPPTTRGGVYAETFALWLFLFLALMTGLGALTQIVDVPAAPFAAGLVGMFGSLSALAWPLVRGVPFHVLREDIGLHAGRGPMVETFAGFGGYAIALPLLIVGAIMMIALTQIFQPDGTPSHPAVEGIASAGAGELFVIFLLACVAAPIVEETMFRGVLYRHLRDASATLGIIGSVALSALVSSVLFAAIHPQGLLFIPILTGLAIGFCITRELRGSLWPCMVAHAITNFVTLTLNVVLMGG